MEKPESGHICYNNPILLEPIGLKGGRINPNFPLSTRTKNCLMADGVPYVATLTSLTNRQLLKIPGLGKESYHEVINLLAAHGLKPEMFPSERLTKEDQIINFFSIRFAGVSVKVLLPSDLINGISDDDIISSIRGACQSAFEIAVLRQAKKECLKSGQRVSINIHKKPDKADLPLGNFREVIVPLDVAGLGAAFNKDLLERSAKSINGKVLYPELKSALEAILN